MKTYYIVGNDVNDGMRWYFIKDYTNEEQPVSRYDYTEDKNEAQTFNDLDEAREVRRNIRNYQNVCVGDDGSGDDFSPVEVWRVAFYEEGAFYAEFYQGNTIKTKYLFNYDGPDEETYSPTVGESMEMYFNEAKQILNESGYQLIDEALEGPATSKQLWTLYKLTKKDYRGKNLSKEDAFKMIGDLLKNKENGSTEEKKEKQVKKTPKAAKPKINDNPLVHVGDIFRFSFGYDMTINQYYKVLSTKGKKAQVVEIGTKWVTGSPGYTGEVIPDPDNEVDEPTTALIKDDGNIRVKMYDRYHTAYPDSGSPSYENHMD
jgi:hypothetical protein